MLKKFISLHTSTAGTCIKGFILAALFFLATEDAHMEIKPEAPHMAPRAWEYKKKH